MSRLRQAGHRRDDDGFTVIEVTLTSALLLVVLAILFPLLTGSLTTFQRQTDRSGAEDQAALALQQMEHDVFASTVVNVAGSGTSASPNALQLITYLPSSGGDVASCVEYLVAYQTTTTLPVAITRQAWTLGTTPSTSKWQTLLSNLQLSGAGQLAGYVIPNPVGATPFTSAGSNGQSVSINLQVQNGTSPVSELTTTATGVVANSSGASGAASAWSSQC